MPMNLTVVGPWILGHWLFVLAIVVGAIANLSPRPHPDQLVGKAKIFWFVIDRLSFLTTDKFPTLKMFFVASPTPDVSPPPTREIPPPASPQEPKP